MQQPELGRRLTALRKERNLTQEELVEKSHVSVRTIQRIEAGEVLPRMSTVKILLEALGERYESFSANPPQAMETQKNILPNANRNAVLVAALAGAVYLVSQIILGTLDFAWITGDRDWGFATNAIYTGLTVVTVVSYALFARGFIVLSRVFENALLKAIAYMLVIATVGLGILDVTSLSVEDVESLWIPYAMAAVLFGALSIVFGVALIRLQDGMGELSRIAGMLEIVIGCALVTVVLFFITYVIMIPAVIVEILVLYRGYEYLSRSASAEVVGA
ncbi:helix-turn-helix domain-containing protein [Chryseolinea soli]|uniref:XRE family transcriptional regulator n=1 Tax=Chryseolinea soli TaxID=2321403 RepID=A0A385SK74_9BACT|nr:helix-turn-helix transcriptional regulator [Chryseolinea soli]AYB31639.1 XRE family transcriptional regulator [Chryseolinea soli]